MEKLNGDAHKEVMFTIGGHTGLNLLPPRKENLLQLPSRNYPGKKNGKKMERGGGTDRLSILISSLVVVGSSKISLKNGKSCNRIPSVFINTKINSKKHNSKI